MKILMVCLGNICRSPLAEGIMRAKVDQHGLNWEVDSAGTSGWHQGEMPDPRSIKVANDYKIDITTQRSRQFTKADFKRYDLILVMDSSNYQDVSRHAPDESSKEKVELIMNYVRPGFNQNVPDPYWDDDGFEKVYQMLDLACEKIIEKFHQKEMPAGR